jgi:hypothetical protein
MADIFLSYAREDRDKAQSFARELHRRGWSVWWDRKLRFGLPFRKVIERELTTAKCVIVLWSATSIESDWVIGEASEGARRGVLIPARIEDIRVPLEFRGLHTADLFGITEIDELNECAIAIAALAPPRPNDIAGDENTPTLPGGPPEMPSFLATPKTSRARAVAIGVIATLLVTIGIGFVFRHAIAKSSTFTTSRSPADIASNAPVDVWRQLMPLLTTYEAVDQPYNWPGGDSGITIGWGYDLGYVTSDQYARDWKSLNLNVKSALARAIGLRGEPARSVASTFRGIRIEEKAAVDAFFHADYPRYYTMTERTFPGLRELPPAAQAALVSLIYNRGEKMGGDNRKEVALIHDAVLAKDLPEIAKQLRSMSRLWIGKGLDGLVERR